jgi:hypothetical protein
MNISQKQIDSVRSKVEAYLNKNNLKFKISDTEVERDDGKAKHMGYKIETDNLLGLIVPNYTNNKVEFLVLNHHLMEHLVSEGFSDEEINENGKIWIHLDKLSKFQKMFKLTTEIANLK